MCIRDRASSGVIKLLREVWTDTVLPGCSAYSYVTAPALFITFVLLLFFFLQSTGGLICPYWCKYIQSFSIKLFIFDNIRFREIGSCQIGPINLSNLIKILE